MIVKVKPTEWQLDLLAKMQEVPFSLFEIGKPRLNLTAVSGYGHNRNVSDLNELITDHRFLTRFAKYHSDHCQNEIEVHGKV